MKRDTTVDEILMATNREGSILLSDDENESPFVLQVAPKGLHLAKLDKEVLHKTAEQALHDTESIQFRRGCINL